MFALVLGLLLNFFFFGLLTINIKKFGIKNKKINISILYPVADSLMAIFPKRFFGNDEIIKKKMRELYGPRDHEQLVLNRKRELAVGFYFICLIFNLIFLLTNVSNLLLEKEVSQVERYEPNEGNKSVQLQVLMKENDIEYTQPLTLNVGERNLTDEEMDNIFKETIVRIESSILGENADFDHIYKSMNLYKLDKNSLVNIYWSSDHPELIDHYGKVNAYSIKEPVKVQLTAELEKSDQVHLYNKSIKVVPFEDHASNKEYMQKKLEDLLDIMNSQEKSNILKLPSKIDNIEVQWLKPNHQSPFKMIWLMLISVVLLMTTKYNKLNRQIKLKKTNIERDFPDFINKLVLLLNAGLIVQNALEVIAEDYKKYGKNQPLYDELSIVLRSVKESRTSLTEELRSFAKRCQIKEMMRFASIVSENINMGSALSEKLQVEARQTWDNRKRKAEVLGRLAETKLTFPLVILLIVLIVIIMAPAFMEM